MLLAVFAVINAESFEGKLSSDDDHELTKPKTSEDSQFFRRLLRITLRFPSISRMLRNIFEAFENSERTNI